MDSRASPLAPGVGERVVKRVALVAVIAVEYDTAQQVSEAIAENRLTQNLVARGYTVNEIHVHKLHSADAGIEQVASDHRRRRVES